MRFDLDCEVKPGEPLSLAIEDIDEDPEQPRSEFDEAALQGLAETIKATGVRQPISVRVHPNDPERWMLNFGARRLRASKLAGKTDIPGFVDKTANSYDQVIENEQREGLRPLELAMFIQKQLAAGRSRSEIARRLGKSAQYVTYACALIDPPDWLLELYRSGRCRGMQELHGLRRLHGEHPHEVARWLADAESIGRSDLQRLKAGWDDRSSTADGETPTPHGLNPFESPTRPEACGPAVAPRPSEGLNPFETRSSLVPKPSVRSAAFGAAADGSSSPARGQRAGEGVSTDLDTPETATTAPRRMGSSGGGIESSNEAVVDDGAVAVILEQLERMLRALKSSSVASDALSLARLQAALLRLAGG